MKIKILLIEPDPLINWYLRVALAERYRVTSSESSECSIRQQIQTEFPDVLLIGERYPRNLLLAQFVRRYAAVPTILLTSDQLFCVQNGDCYYAGTEILGKPLSIRQLTNLIQHVCNRPNVPFF